MPFAVDTPWHVPTTYPNIIVNQRKSARLNDGALLGVRKPACRSFWPWAAMIRQPGSMTRTGLSGWAG
jgi:hypothetical protein